MHSPKRQKLTPISGCPLLFARLSVEPLIILSIRRAVGSWWQTHIEAMKNFVVRLSSEGQIVWCCTLKRCRHRGGNQIRQGGSGVVIVGRVLEHFTRRP